MLRVEERTRATLFRVSTAPVLSLNPKLSTLNSSSSAPPRLGGEKERSRRERGAVFITILVALFVIAVLLMAAVQPFSVILQRDREEELIFRGEEFVEAIRGYQREHGGAYPTKLEDLLKTGPGKRRYLRRLYRNPFDPEGKWGLLAPGQTIVRPRPDGGSDYIDPTNLSAGEGLGGGSPPAFGGAQGFGQGTATGQPGQAAIGIVLPFKFGGTEGQQILGVYAPKRLEAFKVYMEKTYINEWAFSPLVIQPRGTPGRPGQLTQPGQPQFPQGGGPQGPGKPGV